MSAVLMFPKRKAGELIGPDRYAEYERRKQAWIDESLKEATCAPGTYDAAMRRIARECGV